MLKVEEVIALPTASIEHDACIIDEQAEHLLLAVRLPRRFIVENHALMMALSERATGSPAVPTGTGFARAPPKPTRRNMVRCGYITALLAAIILPSPFPTQISRAWSSPPIEYGEFTATKNEFAVGQNIVIAVKYRRFRQCLTAFDRAVQHKSGAYVFSTRVYGGISDPDPEWKVFDLIIKPPNDLGPGDYVYTGMTHSDCSDGIYDLPHPKVSFKVVATGQAGK